MDLAVARERLMKELDVMANRHTVLDNHLRNRDRDVPADSSERATFSENDEVLDALDVATREKIESLQTALVKLDDGTYGLCESCEEEISPERLEAIPWAAVCLSCAD